VRQAPVAPALRALLEGLFDHAGLFPPAALDMEHAWRDFLHHRDSELGWLLGGFVCPLARLPELLEQAGGAAGLPPLTLLADPATLSHGALPADLRVKGWELRLPAGARVEELAGWEAGLPDRAPRYWEPPAAWAPERTSEWAAALRESGGAQGLKLRCGGQAAADFPAVEQVAAMIALARDHSLPLKLTAGLHHPLRHWRPELGAWMHGFLNLYLAALAAQVHGLEPRGLAPILAETRRDAFHLQGDELRWRELRFNTLEIREARRLLPGHGSCSIDEPATDLRAMGWLPGDAMGDTT